jgi:hypothetical protein
MGQMGDNAIIGGPSTSFRVVLRGFQWLLGHMSNRMGKTGTVMDVQVGDPDTS